MKLVQLSRFLQIVRSGSFSAAAEELFISQPALSQMIRQMEEELGTELFERDRKTICLTPAGEVTKRYAERIETKVRGIHYLIDTAKAANSLRLYSTSPLALLKLMSIFDGEEIHLQETCVRKDISPWDLPDDAVAIMLADKKTENEQFSTINFCTETLFLSVPEGNPLARKRKITVNDLAGCDKVLMTDFGKISTLLGNIVEKDGLLLRPVLHREQYVYLKAAETFPGPVAVSSLDMDLMDRKGRKQIPIVDWGLQVEYFLIFRKKYREQIEYLLKRTQEWN